VHWVAAESLDTALHRRGPLTETVPGQFARYDCRSSCITSGESANAHGFASIIEQLERQKSTIERALAALREVDSSDVRAAEQAATSSRPATKKAADIKPAATSEPRTSKRKKFSAAARRKMALAQKARWAKIKGESEPPSPSAPGTSEAKTHDQPGGNAEDHRRHEEALALAASGCQVSSGEEGFSPKDRRR